MLQQSTILVMIC